MIPNSTCELDGWSVVHVIEADVAVMAPELTPLITGIVIGGVANVRLADVAVPAESVEITA